MKAHTWWRPDEPDLLSGPQRSDGWTAEVPGLSQIFNSDKTVCKGFRHVVMEISSSLMSGCCREQKDAHILFSLTLQPEYYSDDQGFYMVLTFWIL